MKKLGWTVVTKGSGDIEITVQRDAANLIADALETINPEGDKEILVAQSMALAIKARTERL